MRLPVGEAFLKNASTLALALALWGSPARALEAYDAGAAPPGSNFAALAQVGTPPLIPPGGAAETGSAPVAAPADAPPPAAADPSAQPLPPLNAAVKAVLDAQAEHDKAHPAAAERRRENEAIAAFYAARDFAPLWSHGGAPDPEVASTLQRLQRAGEDGLDLKAPPVRFAADGPPDAVANADVALSEAVVAYGREASGSRVDPHAISPLIGARPTLADPAVILAIVSSAGEGAGAALQNFNPPQKGYQALRAKLIETRSERAPIVERPRHSRRTGLEGRHARSARAADPGAAQRRRTDRRARTRPHL